ncbi:MAG: hypothetical protein LBI53_07795 [Candidatus Peribacteria bacterium]|jgi:hypothetical protein|nr:hypothetical protein [Candidatus Peribacteria bacterium]
MRDHIVALRQYYQAHSIKSDAKKLYIPYRYVIPLNIVFNRSLQNHSSYYTDIGFSWILVLILLIICLPYALCRRDQQLLAVSITTLVGWALWRVIGGAILWYGTVLISWTAINLFLFITRLRKEEENIVNRYLNSALLIVLGIVLFVQFSLNFIRISAQ